MWNGFYQYKKIYSKMYFYKKSVPALCESFLFVKKSDKTVIMIMLLYNYFEKQA